MKLSIAYPFVLLAATSGIADAQTVYFWKQQNYKGSYISKLGGPLCNNLKFDGYDNAVRSLVTTAGKTCFFYTEDSCKGKVKAIAPNTAQGKLPSAFDKTINSFVCRD